MKNRIIVLFCACALAMMCFTGCDKKDTSKSDGQKEAQEAADSNTAEEEIISGSPADEKPVIEITDAGGGEKPAEEEPAVGMANPWVEITEREANEICLRLFKAPDGATEVKWLKCEKLGNPEQGIKPMVQLSFTLDDLNFTARAWQGAAEDADISGIYTDWTVGPEDVTLANWGDGNMVGSLYVSVGPSAGVILLHRHPHIQLYVQTDIGDAKAPLPNGLPQQISLIQDRPRTQDMGRESCLSRHMPAVRAHAVPLIGAHTLHTIGLVHASLFILLTLL